MNAENDKERERGLQRERLEKWVNSTEVVEAIPAATVILLRDGADGIETLMLKRNSKLAFGGMWVFPGGRIDEGDYPDESRQDIVAAAQRAAVRETMEEAGLDVEHDSLVRLSHWVPPAQTPKRFATWFFVAPAPDGAVTIDQGEIHDHMWVSPIDAIAKRDAAEIELAPPTWVTLHTIALSPTVAHAIQRASENEPEQFTTNAAATDEGIVTMWHGDAGYETGNASAEGSRHRLIMDATGWRYERWGF